MFICERGGVAYDQGDVLTFVLSKIMYCACYGNCGYYMSQTCFDCLLEMLPVLELHASWHPK